MRKIVIRIRTSEVIAGRHVFEAHPFEDAGQAAEFARLHHDELVDVTALAEPAKEEQPNQEPEGNG